MKKGLFSILFLAVMLFGMTAMVAGQDSTVVSDSVVTDDPVVIPNPGDLTLQGLFMTLITAVISFSSKFVVDAAVKWPSVPNYVVAAGGLVLVCLIAWGTALLLGLNVVWAVTAAATGYMGGSIVQTGRKPNLK